MITDCEKLRARVGQEQLAISRVQSILEMVEATQKRLKYPLFLSLFSRVGCQFRLKRSIILFSRTAANHLSHGELTYTNVTQSYCRGSRACEFIGGQFTHRPIASG
jgi:hypothetical protein